MTRPRCGSRAFVAAEAVALLAVGVIFLGMFLVSTVDTRRQGRLSRDLGNLRQIGAWTFAYAGDYEGLYPTFSAVPNSIWPDLRATAAYHPLIQAGGHATDIIRRRTGRDTFPRPLGWIPHLSYSHLVLADYAGRNLPDSMFVSTGDKHRLNWLDDPINKHDEGFWQPFQNPESGAVEPSAWRWPYSASFHTPFAWFDKSELMSRLIPSSNRTVSLPTGSDLGGLRLSAVVFPAQKVMMHDTGAWHFSRQPRYYLKKDARVAVLLADGGAGARLTGDANQGWRPNGPWIVNPPKLSYVPRPWEPPTADPNGRERVIAHYLLTRGGIEGRDFDGPEIDTGQK